MDISYIHIGFAAKPSHQSIFFFSLPSFKISFSDVIIQDNDTTLQSYRYSEYSEALSSQSVAKICHQVPIGLNMVKTHKNKRHKYSNSNNGRFWSKINLRMTFFPTLHSSLMSPLGVLTTTDILFLAEVNSITLSIS